MAPPPFFSDKRNIFLIPLLFALAEEVVLRSENLGSCLNACRLSAHDESPPFWPSSFFVFQ